MARTRDTTIRSNNDDESKAPLKYVHHIFLLCRIYFCEKKHAHNSLGVDRHKENKNARENLVSVAYFILDLI